MYKFKCMILVIVVILGLGCSKREEKGGSSASNMKLSDISSKTRSSKVLSSLCIVNTYFSGLCAQSSLLHEPYKAKL